MASQKTKFMVGLFVAGGISIGLLAIIWLGMSRYFQEGKYYVTYFNESVQGLDRDSPVKYRGVSIGRVESIDVAPDSELIEVVLKVESGLTLDQNTVAQLKAVGITGSVFIELDRLEPGEPDRSPALSFPSKYPVVASKPAEISELLRGVDDALNQIRALDLEGLSAKIKATLDNINQIIVDADIKRLSTHVGASLEGVEALLNKDRWNRIGDSAERTVGETHAMIKSAHQSLGRLERTLARVERITANIEKPVLRTAQSLQAAAGSAEALFEKGKGVVGRTDETLADLRRYLIPVARNLKTASENLNRLLEDLGEQPSRIFFGRPPAPRPLEKGP